MNVAVILSLSIWSLTLPWPTKTEVLLRTRIEHYAAPLTIGSPLAIISESIPLWLQIRARPKQQGRLLVSSDVGWWIGLNQAKWGGHQLLIPTRTYRLKDRDTWSCHRTRWAMLSNPTLLFFDFMLRAFVHHPFKICESQRRLRLRTCDRLPFQNILT